MSNTNNSQNTKPGLPTKLFGTYPQKQQELYMQRIPIFAGNITVSQLKEVAEIAKDFTDSTPLHLTTRQDIELHNVPQQRLGEIQKRLYDAGFNTFGAGGDCVRNITVCPCCSFNPEAFNVEPLGELLKEALLQSPLLEDMPRKFKISFAGCSDPQSKPYVNDLSFVATSENTVRVIGAGSLGPRPEPGIVLYNRIPVEDVIPLTLSAVELFVDHGDRENRRKARLRHIRQKKGDAAFVVKLDEYFQRTKKRSSFPKITLEKSEKDWTKAATIQTVAGQLDVQHALALADAVEKNDGRIRININHGLEIYAKKTVNFPDSLNEYLHRPVIVACPGSTTCKNGLVDCPATAEMLSEALKGNQALAGKIIAISGCPNNCIHSCVADIGLTGQVKTIDGERQQAYKIVTGGGNGKTEKLAQEKGTVSAEDILQEILKLIE